MKRVVLLLTIVWVAQTVLGGEIVAASAKQPGNVAALLQSVLRAHPRRVEIITFGASRWAPVKVVRGGTGRAAAALRPIADRRRSDGTIEVVSFADHREPPVTVLRGSAILEADPELTAPRASYAASLSAALSPIDLDRVAFAIDGAESSHGADPAMWRPDLDGPEGPMQVSAAAALDSGGGDRFDPIQNRRLGRAYLALLYHHYGNWPDAVAAYNWGPGNMDTWIDSGRQQFGLPLEVEHYRDRVLRDGGIVK